MILLQLGVVGLFTYDLVHKQYWYAKDGVIRRNVVKECTASYSIHNGVRRVSGYTITIPASDGVTSVESSTEVAVGERIRYLVSPTLQRAEVYSGKTVREWLWLQIWRGELLWVLFGMGCMGYTSYDQLKKTKRVINGLPVDEDEYQAALANVQPSSKPKPSIEPAMEDLEDFSVNRKVWFLFVALLICAAAMLGVWDFSR